MAIIRKVLSKDHKPVLTQEQEDRLDALKDRPIDLSDAPEQLDWSNAVRGRFTKKRLPIDDDVYEWLSRDGQNPEKVINEVLHKMMAGEG